MDQLALKTLNLTHFGLGPKGGTALAYCLRVNVRCPSTAMRSAAQRTGVHVGCMRLRFCLQRCIDTLLLAHNWLLSTL
jgi:hypothetical protein